MSRMPELSSGAVGPSRKIPPHVKPNLWQITSIIKGINSLHTNHFLLIGVSSRAAVKYGLVWLGLQQAKTGFWSNSARKALQRIVITTTQKPKAVQKGNARNIKKLLKKLQLQLDSQFASSVLKSGCQRSQYSQYSQLDHPDKCLDLICVSHTEPANAFSSFPQGSHGLQPFLPHSFTWLRSFQAVKHIKH